MGKDELYAVGKIIRVRGLKGEVVVAPLTTDLDRFAKLEKVLLEADSVVELEIESVRKYKKLALLRFKGIDNRNDAEKLVGNFLSVARSDLIELPENSYFHFELVGMEVYSQENEYLGKIVEITTMPANDVWRVTGRKEFLLPATSNVVLDVDRVNRKITIKLLQGLID